MEGGEDDDESERERKKGRERERAKTVRKEGVRGRKMREGEKGRGDGVRLAGAHQMKWLGGQLNRKAL